MRPADRTFATQTDADMWLTVKEAEIVKGDWLDPGAGRVPLGEYADRWIGERSLAPRTVEKYRHLLRLRLRPKLAAVDLVDLTPDRVRTWRAGLLADGVGAS